jgi:ERCC4-related helicase
MHREDATVRREVRGPLRPGALEPRPYQEEIVREAVDMNTLVVLPTGLGKTLVSALLCARLLGAYPGTKALVMAPTRPLVAQHRKSFYEVLDLDEDEMVMMTGHVQPGARVELWSEGRVFFTTPQVVENDIQGGRLSLREFSLVVFDEAHRAVKDYAYTSIARHYMEEGAYPIILALTASPGGNKDRVKEVCENLSIERIIHRTQEDEDVGQYVHRIDTDWREVDLPEEYRSISACLRDMLDARVAKLRHHHPLPDRYVGKRHLLALGQRLRDRLKDAIPGERGGIFGAMLLQSTALSLVHAIELLESQGIRPLLRFLNKVDDEKDQKKAYKNLAKDPMFHKVMREVVDNIDIEHPKVEVLKLEMLREFGRSERTRVLVFTQYRDTASLLVNALRNDVFVVERFVGQASRLGDEGLGQEEQGEVLERFRKGDITVLVATSVAEEGLDIPNVDLVVFYEPVPSEIRYIQRKGRTGRKRIGRVVLLATRDSVDTGAHHASQRKIRRMREVMGSIDSTLKRVERGKRPRPVLAKGTGGTVHGDAAPREGVGRGMGKGRYGPQVPAQASARSDGTIRPSTTVRPSTDGPTAPIVRNETELVRRFLLDHLDDTGQTSIEEVYEEGSEAGFDRALLRKGIEMLVADGCIYRPRWDIVRKVEAKDGKEEDVFEVTVRKVHQGRAILSLDDGTDLVLDPEDFPAGPAYIKKGRSFRVRGRIVEEKGRRHLRVADILD